MCIYIYAHTQFYETGIIIVPIVSVWGQSGELFILTEIFNIRCQIKKMTLRYHGGSNWTSKAVEKMEEEKLELLKLSLKEGPCGYEAQSSVEGMLLGVVFAILRKYNEADFRC